MPLPKGITRRRGRPGYHGTYYGADGKRHTVALGGNLKLAVEKLNKLRYDADRARSGLMDDASQDYPLSRLFEEYVQHVRSRGKANSRHWTEVKRSLEGFTQAFPGLSVARQVTSGRLLEYQSELLRLDLAAGTINNRCEHVVSCLYWAERVGRIARSQARHPKRLSQEGEARRLERRTLTKAELDSLIAAAESIDGRLKTPARSPLLCVVAATGLRIGEALALRWCDLVVHPGGRSARVTSQTSKTRKEREVPIPADVADALLALRTTAGSLLGRLPTDEDHIFLSQRGTRLTYNGAASWFVMIRELAGVPHKTAEGACDWHALRHTFVTDMLRAGAGIETVSHLTGHATLGMTMRVYAKLEKVDSRSAVEAMQRMRQGRGMRKEDEA